MKVQFKKGVDTPKAHVAEGGFKRTFDRAQQPFDVTPDEWAILQRSDLFEEAAKPVKQEQQQQQEKKQDAENKN